MDVAACQSLQQEFVTNIISFVQGGERCCMVCHKDTAAISKIRENELRALFVQRLMAPYGEDCKAKRLEQESLSVHLDGLNVHCSGKTIGDVFRQIGYEVGSAVFSKQKTKQHIETQVLNEYMERAKIIIPHIVQIIINLLGAPTLFDCGKCRRVQYCSQSCAKIDWNTCHKHECEHIRRQTHQ